MNQQWNPSQLNQSEERLHLLQEWLRQAFPYKDLSPLQGAASFRRYFRLFTEENMSFIVMDAPPEKEDVKRVVTMAHFLRSYELNAPEIFVQNVDKGFLVLSDFGDLTFLRAFQQFPPNKLYQKALNVLSQIQTINNTQHLALPHFTHDFMQTEWMLHQEWFIQKLLGLEVFPLQSSYDLLIENALLQPQVLMYRDFHSENLMLLANGDVGLLDFQDAFIGPLTYDLASLLRDCYVEWPRQQVIEWALFYYSLLSREGKLQTISQGQFLQWFDLMSVQRHLKALMTFARKVVRDQEQHYLNFIPRTLQYIISVTNTYEELSSLHSYYNEQVKPVFMEKFS